MKKKKLIIGIIAIIAVVIFFVLLLKDSEPESQYSFVEIERGDLENIVSSTGTLNPVRTVEVGTQVSGIINELFVDFNDNVKKGQVLAILDTVKLAGSIREAKSGLIRAEAQYDQSIYNYNRNKDLFEQHLVSELEFKASETEKRTAYASLLTSKITLERAETNMKYAVVKSPIDGKVIHRSVEPGQTVAASFQTPTLFLIAEDLSKMEIHADVDESDVGQVKEGQPVRFTVQAYPDKTFNGRVRQIWLQPTTIQNVVNYTVVVDAANDEGFLLPGMTATVDFIVEHRQDVLLVPNTALRFQPTEEMIANVRKNIHNRFDTLPDSIRVRRRQPAEIPQGKFAENQPKPSSFNENVMKNSASLWYIDDEGNFAVRRVRTGITNGKMTEIVSNISIYKGMRVINGLLKSSEKQSSERRSGPGFGRPPF